MIFAKPKDLCEKRCSETRCNIAFRTAQEFKSPYNQAYECSRGRSNDRMRSQLSRRGADSGAVLSASGRGDGNPCCG